MAGRRGGALLALKRHLLIGKNMALGTLLRDENGAAVAVVGEKAHKYAGGLQVALGLFIDENVNHAVCGHIVALEDRWHPSRIDITLTDQEPLERIANRGMRGVKHDVAVVVRGTPCAYETHVDSSACDDAEKRVTTPQLKRHNENARKIRPSRLPLEPRIRIEDKRGDYHRRHKIPKARDPLRKFPVATGEEYKRQGPQRVVHEEPDGHDAQHVYDFALHFAARDSKIAPTRTASSGVSTPTPSSSVRTTAILAPIQSARSCSSFSVFSSGHGGSEMYFFRNAPR